MELIYITHHSILDLHALSSTISWPLVIGAGYGFTSLIRDVVAAVRKATPSK